MQLGMVGLGRMGANLVRRLMRDGHECFVNDVNQDSIDELAKEGAKPASSYADMAKQMDAPRAIWVMVPAGITGMVVNEVADALEAGDTIIDGGNSYYVDDIHRAQVLSAHGIDYIDCGTSGGVWGLERGYCLMIGGPKDPVDRLDSIFASIAPGAGNVDKTPGRKSGDTRPERGYMHCGPNGAGHFVKMVHNGIEYGQMAAIAEGLNVIKNANVGEKPVVDDAETTPLRDPDLYKYDINVGDCAEVWRRGAVISSWLMDLTADALAKAPDLSDFAGRVSDSGEGRWTIRAAIDEGVPVPVLATALFERFSSRGNADFADKLLSAMRNEFGGHDEKPAGS